MYMGQVVGLERDANKQRRKGEKGIDGGREETHGSTWKRQLSSLFCYSLEHLIHSYVQWPLILLLLLLSDSRHSSLVLLSVCPLVFWGWHHLVYTRPPFLFLVPVSFSPFILSVMVRGWMGWLLWRGSPCTFSLGSHILRLQILFFEHSLNPGTEDVEGRFRIAIPLLSM